MGLKYHTVIVVPHARARFRKFRISNRQLAVVITSLVLVTLASLFGTWSFLTNTVNLRELEQITNENQELRRVNQTFELSIHSLEKQLAEYEERTRRLAIVAGLEVIGSSDEAGIGGPSTSNDVLGVLDPLNTRAAELGPELDRIEAKLDDELAWISATPAIAPVKGLLTSGFGYRRDPVTGERAYHRGIDIAAAPGRPVRATADGIVTRAGNLGRDGLGRAVYVAHGYGVTTRYGHLKKVLVQPGEHVARGQVIGEVGSTGRATGYHLHYEVRVDHQAVNPFAYILESTSRGS